MVLGGAIEALATSVPLFLLLFAGSYVVMSAMSDSNFDMRMTHTDGLYFTVTVFSTVGFGEITPKTRAARLLVTGQMIADLVVLGLAVKVIVGAVSRRRADAGRTASRRDSPLAAAVGSTHCLMRDSPDDSLRGQPVKEQLHSHRGDQEPEDLLGDQHAALVELVAHPVRPADHHY